MCARAVGRVEWAVEAEAVGGGGEGPLVGCRGDRLTRVLTIGKRVESRGSRAGPAGEQSTHSAVRGLDG